MIVIAKSGSEVLQVRGLSTASLVNPEREAKLWVDSQIVPLKVTQADEPVVVMGVASGFHLRALKERLLSAGHRGRLVAIDTCASSIKFTRSHIADVEFLLADTELGPDLFFSRPEVASWILQPFTLLRHKPTYLRSGESLRQIEAWILGRTPEFFSAQLKLRPQIAAGLNPELARKIVAVSLVSVRDLSKAWDTTSELKTDRRLFRVLEELVR